MHPGDLAYYGFSSNYVENEYYPLAQYDYNYNKNAVTNKINYGFLDGKYERPIPIKLWPKNTSNIINFY
jgi:hypothetical protein